MIDEQTRMTLTKKAQYIRKQTFDMCVRAGTGHVTSSFSCTEILVSLYYGGLLRYNPSLPFWEKRDRFILSKAQASVVLYPILADVGFFPETELKNFNKENGIFGVHLQNSVRGVEIMAGSLGHGFGIASGLALAAKLNRERHMVIALLGDGECYEGSIWETAMFSSQYRLNNLFAIIDRNWMCATEFTEDAVALNPLDRKWESFGWEVRMIDGHSFDEIFSAFHNFRSKRTSKPTVIIADTTKGKGSESLCYEPFLHAVAPKGDDAKKARKELNECG